MPAFAIYRLPHDDHAIMVEQSSGEPEEFLSCTELNGKRGFVIAPFEVKDDQPILLIRPDVVKEVPLDCKKGMTVREYPVADCSQSSTSAYSIDFANYHSQLELGTFRKIVLALGGSATNDCGCGMASACGVRFYDYGSYLDNRSFVRTRIRTSSSRCR